MGIQTNLIASFDTLTLTDVRALNSVISRFSRHAGPIAGQLSRHDNFWILTVFPKVLPNSRNWALHLSLASSVELVVASFFSGLKSVSKKHQMLWVE